jgi:hypothetical protein
MVQPHEPAANAGADQTLTPLPAQPLAQQPCLVVDEIPARLPAGLHYRGVSPDRWKFHEADCRPSAWPTLRALGEGAYAWAVHVNRVHRQLHPIFSDQYLTSLNEPDAPKELQGNHLRTTVMLRFRGDTGELAGLVLTSPSIAPAFDAAVLEAWLMMPPVSPPKEALSADGFVYVMWTLSRDPVQACSTFNMWPRAFEATPAVFL